MDQVKVLRRPTKSEGDPKEYRLIKLPNGLKALLIHLPEHSPGARNDVLAAACLTIGLASFDEPLHIGGLAHFLEHMLFLGSEKYPDENGYNQTVAENGGFNNATTDVEHTFYYFDVGESVFPETLDRFAQQFISPLLLRDALQREREAVDSEFQMAMAKDSKRMEAFYRTFIFENHPTGCFDYGNLQSLKHDIDDDELYDAVREFFDKYIANNMTLSIQSKRPLEEMQQMVVETFSAIKSGPITVRPHQYDTIEQIFKPNFYEKMHWVKPKKELSDLIITWVLDSVHPHYKCSPLQYIEKIFNNQGEGGISAVLLRQKLAIACDFMITMPTFENNSMFALAKFKVSMSDYGFNHFPEVIEVIFSYLLMLRETPLSEHRRLFQEFKEKRENDFKFHKELSPSENTINTSIAMKYFKNEDILKENSFEEFDQKAITRIIKTLNQRKFNMTIVSNDHDEFKYKMKYYGIEYDEFDIPEDYVTLWNNRELNEDFFLEKPNPYKSTNFEIFINPQESQVRRFQTT